MIFEGIAAGTFLYVGIIEILMPEFKHEHRELSPNASHIAKYGNTYKLLSLVVGSILMSYLGLYV